MKIRAIGLTVFCLIAAIPTARAGLLTHVELAQNGANFSYTVFNDEPVDSPNFISTWHLNVNARFTIIGTPDGWTFDTDNETYVDWINTDPILPYPHDVAPGASLGGFILASEVTTSELLPYTVGSWDHVADSSGPSYQNDILSPSGASSIAVPEPSTLISGGIAGLFGLGYGLRRRKAKATA